MSTHENLKGHGPEPRPGSERSFALVFTVVFTLIGLYPLLGDGSPAWWALAIAAVFAALGLAAPSTLVPLNRAWFRFGMLLGAVVAPIALGIVFFVTVMPTGLIMRALGKDPLRLRRDPDAQSYWHLRRPPGPPPDSLERQF